MDVPRETICIWTAEHAPTWACSPFGILHDTDGIVFIPVHFDHKGDDETYDLLCDRLTEADLPTNYGQLPDGSRVLLVEGLGKLLMDLAGQGE